jgi:hypothetical protein
MSEAHTIRVLIVDDHEIIRTGNTYSLTTFFVGSAPGP